jgi:hypothetical protein
MGGQVSKNKGKLAIVTALQGASGMNCRSAAREDGFDLLVVANEPQIHPGR